MISANMIKLSLGLAAMGFFTPALAHMEMTAPVPINSKLDPAAKNPDYSMTAPLAGDGSNFPCKGYATPENIALGSKATLNAGGSIDVTISGGAAHEGGSCQFSLSYDGGKTFGAIHDVVGGCPLQPNYSVPIPAGVPSGKGVLFAWTWFNHTGNREMYMNCAVVDVVGASAPFTTPGMFKANIGNCVAPEGTDVDFKAPPAGCEKPGDVTLSGDGSGGGGGKDAPPPPPAAPPADAPPAPPAPPADAPPAPPADGQPAGSCDGDVEGMPTDPPTSGGKDPNKPDPKDAPKADPPKADPPKADPAPAGSCKPNESKCDGDKWSLCDNGRWVNMGAIPPGTTCSDKSGAVSFRQSKHKRAGYQGVTF